MAEKQITREDLQNLEIKVKSDISKEQMELRHEDRKKLQEYYYMVDDLKTDSALSKQSFITMTKSIDEMKQMMKDLSKEIKEEIKSMH